MQTQHFIHNIDPTFASVWGVDLYYYGLAYAIGFLGIFIWFRMHRRSLGWSLPEVYNFSILFSLGVLLLGRLFSVFVYHWDYYSTHPNELFSYWNGGMATHGVLLGGTGAVVLFSRLHKKPFLQLADEIVIPAALFLALGRIGNFINGQIAGTATDVWWAVEFPDIEGFRHPVTLYESLKNFMLIPILIIVRRKSPPGRGIMMAHFIFWYGFLRIFADLYRDHGAQFFGIGRNQYFNGLMAVVGLILMGVLATRAKRQLPESAHLQSTRLDEALGQKLSNRENIPALWFRRIVFTVILLFCLAVRSAWTPEVLEEHRARAVHNEPEDRHEKHMDMYYNDADSHDDRRH